MSRTGFNKDTPNKKFLDDQYTKGVLYCRKCKKFKVKSLFSRSKNSKISYGYYMYCKSCHSGMRKGVPSYKNNARLFARNRKKEVIKKLGGVCMRCNYDEYQDGLEFHHVNPENKVQEDASYLRPRDVCFIEFDKCCLLCSCCHKSIKQWEHAVKFIKKEYGWGLIKNDT